jgi:hypothetical protein
MVTRTALACGRDGDGSAPLTLSGVVKTTNDGKGNFTQVDAVGVNGDVAPGWRPGTGTYTVNPDCTGTATITIPGMPDLAYAVYRFPIRKYIALCGDRSKFRNCRRIGACSPPEKIELQILGKRLWSSGAPVAPLTTFDPARGSWQRLSPARSGMGRRFCVRASRQPPKALHAQGGL